MKAVPLRKRLGEIIFARELGANGGIWRGVSRKDQFVVEPPQDVLDILNARELARLVVAYAA